MARPSYEELEQRLAKVESELAAARQQQQRQQQREHLDAARTSALEHANRLDAVLAALPMGVAIVDERGGNIKGNEQFRRIWGDIRAADDVGGYVQYKAWWPDSGEPVKPEEWASAQAVLKGETITGQVVEIERFDGTRAFVHNSAAPIRDASGRITGAAVAIQDITALRTAESASRQTEQRMQLALTIGRSFTFEWDPRTDTVKRSDSCSEILGLSGAVVEHDTGQDYFSRIHPEDREGFVRMLGQLNPKTADYRTEYRVVRADGSIVALEEIGRASFDAAGNLSRLIGVTHDITARKQAEDALRKSESRFRLFIEHAPAALAMFDREMRYLSVSNRWLQDYKLGDRNLIGLSHYEVFPEIPDAWKDVHRRGLAGEILRAEEDRFVRADGSDQFLRWEVRPWHDVSGNVGGIVIFTEEITAHKKAEQALEHERGLLKSVLQATDVMLVYLDRDFNFVWVNAAYAATCNSTPEEMVGKNHFALYPHAENEAIFRQVRDTGEPAFFKDKPFEFPDQPERGITYWDWSLVPVKDAAGMVQGLVFSLRETTKHKQAVDALARHRGELQNILDSCPAMIFYKDRGNRFLRVNRAFAETMRMPKEELEGASAFDLYPRDQAESFLKDDQEVMASAKPKIGIVEPVSTSDGLRWFQTDKVPSRDERGEIDGVVGFALDITQRRQVEEALRQALAKAEEGDRLLAALMDHVPEGITVADSTGKIRLVSRHGQDLLGGPHTDMSVEQVVGRWAVYCADGINPMPTSELPLVRALRGEVVRDLELIQASQDGRKLPLLCNAAPIRDESGQIVGGVVAWRDIGERKQAEQALRDSEQRYRHLFEDDLTGDFVATIGGEILLCNPAFVRLYGFANEQEALGSNLAALKANPEDWPRLLDLLKRDGRVERREVIHRRRDGRTIHVVENVIGYFGDDGRLARIQGYVFDDTDRKMAEESLLQAKADLEQKVQDRTVELVQRAAQLRALAGELTISEQRERRRMAKVLHDHLQQILVAAKFRVTILGRAGDKVIREASSEIDNLLNDAIDVSRSLTTELSPPILHEGGLVPGLEWLARWMLDKHGLVVDMTAEPGLPDVADDVRVLLFESIRELLLNAVKHARVRLASVNIRPIGDDQVQLMVSDTGPGFDPTKVKMTGERGGGFGLFSVRERLDLIGGRLEIDSAPGKGSRFTLIAPVGQPQAVAPAELVPAIRAAVEEAPRAVPPKTGATIRVLLADDHTVMRQGLSSLLEGEPDIEVIGEAADGQEAIDLARQLVPDVILMDLSMPKVSGEEATRVIHAEHPEICVIGLSMFAAEDRAQALRDAGASAYLTKSGPAEDMIVAIRKCMKGQASESRPAKEPREAGTIRKKGRAKK